MALVYGRVVGTLVELHGDGSDPDQEPDVVGAADVRVTFNPVRGTFVSDVSSMIASHKPVICTVNTDGALIGPTGEIGVWLLAADYVVTFTKRFHKRFPITVTASHTQNNPFNLGDGVSFEPSPGTVVQTVILPSGAAEGQFLQWVAGEITWVNEPGGAADLTALEQHVEDHIASPTPHSAYDDMPSLVLLFENGLV